MKNNPLSFWNWPKKVKPGDHNWCINSDGANVISICILGRKTGLRYWKDDKQFSVDLDHPLANHWLSILKPMWEKRNKGKCKTCHGTGWDGIGYTLTCVDCGGDGKENI